MSTLRDSISKSSSRKDLKNIALELSQNNDIRGLLELFLDEDRRMQQKTASIVNELLKLDRNAFYPYQEKLMSVLEKGVGLALERNIIRVFQEAYIREEIEGSLLDYTFTLLENPTKPIANRAFAMQVAYKIGERYPEVFPELQSLIENNVALNPSPAIKNRAQKILHKIQTFRA